MKWVGNDGQELDFDVFDFPGSGVAMGMYNLDASIRDFAHACFNYSLGREMAALSVDEEHDPQGL